MFDHIGLCGAVIDISVIAGESRVEIRIAGGPAVGGVVAYIQPTMGSYSPAGITRPDLPVGFAATRVAFRGGEDLVAIKVNTAGFVGKSFYGSFFLAPVRFCSPGGQRKKYEEWRVDPGAFS